MGSRIDASEWEKMWCIVEDENQQLKNELEINENYQDKLHDEIDNLRKVIALLSKDWL